MAAPAAKGPADPHGEGGGGKTPGRIPLSSHHGHQTPGKEQGQYPTPPPLQVKYFHRFADTDGDATSLHHTLGGGGTQAAPGDHKHDGGSSGYLFDAFTVSGARPTAGTGADSSWAKSIEAALQAVGINVTATG